MIVCIIEFGVRKGMEAKLREALEPLLIEVKDIPGFISKETFESRVAPGRMFTVSYWENREAMKAWMANANHRKAMAAGKREIFSDYTIRIAEIERSYDWVAPIHESPIPGAG